MKQLATLAALALITLVAGCAAPTTQVILLPQANGHSAVEVRSRTTTVVLSTPYVQVQVDPRGDIEANPSSPAEVEAQYGQLLAIQPAPERRYSLFFETGGTELTAESQAALASILEQATQRPGGEIIVTGHTDSVGSTTSNDALSLRRAQATRELLISRGFDPRLIEAVGRGERELAVPTDDETPEPRNRRTEIIVR